MQRAGRQRTFYTRTYRTAAYAAFGKRKTSLHKRGTHASNNTHAQYKRAQYIYIPASKPCVYTAVQLLRITILHIHMQHIHCLIKRVAGPYPEREGNTSVARDVTRQKSSTRPADEGTAYFEHHVRSFEKLEFQRTVMVRRHTASNVLTRSSRPGVSQHPIPGPQGTMARPSSGGMHAGRSAWPMAMRVAEPAGHRERVARPQAPDKTAHRRLQHTEIERGWVGPQIACELRRGLRTDP